MKDRLPGRQFVLTLCLALWLSPQPVSARTGGPTTACKSNLKNIGTSLEMWASDHGGVYPDSLQALIPDYLREIPECPASRADTYSETYRLSKRKTVFGVCCLGAGHVKTGYLPNQPAYNSVQGLVEGQESPPGPSLSACQQTLAEVAKLAESDTNKPRRKRPVVYGLYSDYWVDYTMGDSPESVSRDGFEVICVGHAHGKENVPPLYPRFDSAVGVEAFTPLPPPRPLPAPLSISPRQAIPAAAAVLILALLGAGRRRRVKAG